MITNLQIPHWDATHRDGIGGAASPFPINELVTHTVADDSDMPVHDVFSTDHFRMFHFKVRNCPRGRSHDWTECPYAHPGEKARRRDPRKYQYSATACPEFRRGNCNRGESCHLAHGVFECWLHPSRYRTHLCNDGTSCRRKVCFFAHRAEQLRVLTPIRQNGSFVSSPTSVLNSWVLSESPPTSPSPGNTRFKEVNVREIVSSMRNVQLDEVSSTGLTRMGPGGWSRRPEFMERVESGREGRGTKLNRGNSTGASEGGLSAPVPDIDFGWVSELVK